MSTDEQRQKRIRQQRNRRLAAIMRIYGLITQPLPADALPPPTPPVVEIDRRKKGGQGSSREDELGNSPEAAVLQRLGRLAAVVSDEREAEAYAAALPMLAATMVPSSAPGLTRAAPLLATGMATAARVLRQSPDTRDLVRSLPAVAHTTARRVGRRTQTGQAVSAGDCTRLLADTAVRVLGKAALENAGRPHLPVLTFDWNTHCRLADNIWHAQAAGHPDELTYIGDRAAARRNRAAAIAGIPPLNSRDEYPFASTCEGGRRAWIGHIPAAQNSAQGGILSNFYRRHSQGGRPFTFRVSVVNHPRGPVPPLVTGTPVRPRPLSAAQRAELTRCFVRSG